MSSGEEDQEEEPAGKTILPSNLLDQRPGEEHLYLLCKESHGLLPLHDGRFSKWSLFSII